MGLKLEFHEVANLPELERLWIEETDWGGEALQSLNKWFMAAPFGKPSIVVASDERTGKMVGQFRFLPSRVSVDGREVSAVRPFGTIVTREAHEAAGARRVVDNPIAAMYLRAVREFRNRGVGVVYIVPDQRWLGLFKRWATTLKLLKMNYGTFPLWSLPLPLQSELTLPSGFSAGPLVEWDSRVDKLWETSQKLHQCQMLRDASTLQWKLANAKHTVTAIHRGYELVGVVASRAKGDRQWLICDMLAADEGEAMCATLSAAANVAHNESLKRTGADEIRKVGVLATPVIEPVLRQLGFSRDDYDFPLLVHVIGKSLKAKQVSPSKWYVSAND